ncbi:MULTISPECIES: MATE family efflux transporter [Lacrimispora]|jgi:putative MATE family efflux protein|uniref:Probable multidrug resistance protein NorM n=1 Tax=Lacrimispora sphenoides JCM 1415 TaxID=1297793 RepID=A0ABY1CB20_9FIRM|nr:MULTISPECIES: MATE family efflux transporter [Lacrimispora]EXG88094.1 putative efflux protein, MATE family [Clostridium sp. ASBs410]MDR7811864.1 MATE family efflux transporter [Lacrimispora sp.]SET87930.1 putative efflux protein, MATE family [[Clostridium] sphenoides JCM 1415]SEU04869.1 putative efflux protein, MATE family [Lacrimispora sphenoides]SUY52010.1 MATE efflux family protein [Lacrimispora sphenoides]
MQSNFLKQSNEQRRDLILNGSVSATILFLSVPTLMMGLIQSAIPVIDGLFLNNLVGTQAASAVTYCTPIVNMISALAQGVSVAGMAIIGQSNGNGNFKHSRKISTQIIVFTFLLGFLLAPLLIALAFPISAHVNEEISHDVFVYLALSACVTPFSFMESIYNSIKNANGKPEDTFVRMVIMLILKIIFSALFIVVFHWGLVGSVMASLASNFLITGWMYYELFLKKTGERFVLKGFRFDWTIINTLMRIGFPAMLSSLMLNLGFFLINNEVEKYGAVVLNGQGIANNITSICFILPSSFGSAVTTMVSMNVGANQPEKAKKACLVGCVISAITAALLIALVVPLSSKLTVLFTRDASVLAVANQALHIYTYSVIGFGICMVQQGAFIGLGKTRITLFISLLRVWLLRYIFILATEQFLSFYSVFWGNLFSNYMAAIITTILIFRVKWVSDINY